MRRVLGAGTGAVRPGCAACQLTSAAANGSRACPSASAEVSLPVLVCAEDRLAGLAVFEGAERLFSLGPLSPLCAASGSAFRPTVMHTSTTAITPPPTSADLGSQLWPVMI